MLLLLLAESCCGAGTGTENRERLTCVLLAWPKAALRRRKQLGLNIEDRGEEGELEQDGGVGGRRQRGRGLCTAGASVCAQMFGFIKCRREAIRMWEGVVLLESGGGGLRAGSQVMILDLDRSKGAIDRRRGTDPHPPDINTTTNSGSWSFRWEWKGAEF